ncbi:MAG TPA: SpoVG family protein [Elusimicrobiota bacterium]|nr:SpoVG family protein [Elusimicrobiota bacterium]
MEITEIRVHLRAEDKLKAFVTVTFDGCFVVRNMKIIEGNKGLILCMPSRKLPNGTYKDVAHPISMEFRKVLEDKILTAYRDEETKAAKTGQKPRAGEDEE